MTKNIVAAKIFNGLILLKIDFGKV